MNLFIRSILSAFSFDYFYQNIDWGFDWVSNIFSISFVFLKYILSFILIILGILILFRFKKNYSKYNINTFQNNLDEKVVVKLSHMVLGVIYIIFGIGILSNFLIYFLIWVLDPIPDRYLFMFINFMGVFNPWGLNGINELSSLTSLERTIFYTIALGSFFAILEIFVSIWLIVSYNRFYIKKAIINLIIGCFLGIFTGFTTCLPLLL
ncbi:MAG: hypothetical protein ACFFBZ_00590 [Promethearchaeota archaeon]